MRLGLRWESAGDGNRFIIQEILDIGMRLDGACDCSHDEVDLTVDVPSTCLAFHVRCSCFYSARTHRESCAASRMICNPRILPRKHAMISQNISTYLRYICTNRKGVCLELRIRRDCRNKCGVQNEPVEAPDHKDHALQDGRACLEIEARTSGFVICVCMRKVEYAL